MFLQSLEKALIQWKNIISVLVSRMCLPWWLFRFLAIQELGFTLLPWLVNLSCFREPIKLLIISKLSSNFNCLAAKEASPATRQFFTALPIMGHCFETKLTCPSTDKSPMSGSFLKWACSRYRLKGQWFFFSVESVVLMANNLLVDLLGSSQLIWTVFHCLQYSTGLS